MSREKVLEVFFSVLSKREQIVKGVTFGRELEVGLIKLDRINGPISVLKPGN